MVKFLVGVGVGVAGKWLYDTWQESQQELNASQDDWEDESPETAQTEQRQAEVPDDLSAIKHYNRYKSVFVCPNFHCFQTP